MKKGMFVVIIVIIILIIIGITAGYLYYKGFFNNKQPRFPRQNFQLNESQINEVTSFFNSSPTSEQIQNYCNASRMNCFYYCRNINPENNYCKELVNFTQGQGNRTRMGNFSRRPGGGMPPQPPQ